MDVVVPPPMVSSGLLPSGMLLESLIRISNEVTSMEKVAFLQTKNISTMMRRTRLLSSLFEEVQDTDKSLPPSSILCLTELYSVIRKVKILIDSCREGSVLWNLMQTEYISNHFYSLVKEMARALDILPLSLLELTADTREQVELLHKQAKRAQLFVDHREIQRRDELVQLMAVTSEKNRKNKGLVDIRRIRDVLSGIGLRSPVEFEEEISKLAAEAEKQAGTGGLLVVSNINNLISLISLSKTTILSGDEHMKTHEDLKKRKMPMNSRHGQSFSQAMVCNIPDEFRCPISLDLMKDPVIVASGHTYDRNSIAQWINSGHHMSEKWAKADPHGSHTQLCIEKSDTPMVPGEQHPKCGLNIIFRARENHQETSNRITRIQRQAAYEIRLLAKTGMENRRIIAEAGAIPFLVTLLGSPDSRIQENAVTALLNLSINENNKTLIMAAGAIDNVVDVLQSGRTMEAKENAAAAVFSLCIIDDYKLIIGAHPRAIPALVGLLGEGTPAGKRDAATALFNLAVLNVNRAKVILAGAIPLLINLLTDDKAGVTDDALAVLALLLGCPKDWKR
ncbi:UNVERIFIED_CONTAM: U-box domain-containing protein 1 [Sesamum radiatum]|uniref:RING-type E3 ubiquitin transferase n=1 Tax=Sesamum radiatum TaxID=300843 RepID=A0AAW2NBV6_SESRA